MDKGLKNFRILRILPSGGVPSGRVCYQQGYPDQFHLHLDSAHNGSPCFLPLVWIFEDNGCFLQGQKYIHRIINLAIDKEALVSVSESHYWPRLTHQKSTFNKNHFLHDEFPFQAVMSPIRGHTMGLLGAYQGPQLHHIPKADIS